MWKKGVLQQYDPESLETAVKTVREGHLSIRKAAAKFKVPKSTLGDHLIRKVPRQAKMGRQPAIPLEVEDKIAQCATENARKGFGVGRKEVMLRAGRVCRTLHIKTPFRGGIPGKNWWRGFKARHPELSIRKPEALAVSRSRLMNPLVVATYFSDLGKVVTSLGLLNKPHCIWNADETGVILTHKPTSVVARKGARGVPGRTANSRESITTLATVNAAGQRMPPLHIVKGKTHKALRAYDTGRGVPGAKWTWQKKAWMEDVLGESWFSDVFLQNCGPERPQLLLMDGHSSHESTGLLEKAREQNIHIITFPPHTTHYLQPLDRACFGPLSASYNEVCSSFMVKHPGNIVSKATFPALFSEAWEKSMNPQNIKAGFSASGIFPFRPTAIPDEAYAPSEPHDRFTTAAPFPTVAQHNQVLSSPEQHPTTEQDSEPPVHKKVAVSMVNDGAIALQPIQESSLNQNLLPGYTEGPISDEDTATLGRSAASSLEAQELCLPLLPNDSSFIANEIPIQEPELASTSTILEELATGVFELACDWNLEVESMFSLPKPQTSSPKKSRAITSHRILTSDEVFLIKKQQEEEKERKEKEKEERKKKREEEKSKKEREKEERKKKREAAKAAKSVKCHEVKKKACSKRRNSNGDNYCFICLGPCDGDVLPSIVCGRCKQVMHQNCIPVTHESVMLEAIAFGAAYLCHECYT